MSPAHPSLHAANRQLMQLKDYRNLVELSFDRAQDNADKPFLWAKRAGAYRPLTWRETAERVARLSRALIAQGVRAGDRVALVSENRPEWLIADFAIMAAGGVTVPSYTTSTTADHLHILENSHAKGAIVSTDSLSRRFLPAAHQADSVEFVICMEPPRLTQSLNARIVDWQAAIDEQAADLADMRETATTIDREDVACLIYTSGTGGAPKGVKIHHGGMLHNVEAARDVLAEIGLKGHVFLSFLPLSHAYEHTAGQALPIAFAAQIYYAEGLDKLAANMAEARPTIMVVVPRLFEMLRARVLKQVEKGSRLRRALFHRALELGIRRFRGDSRLSWPERVQDRLLDKLVRKKIRKRFGGRLRALVSGGAPLNRQVGEFFVGLGLPLLQGYGQTESSPIVSVNRPSAPKIHTVGPPLPGVEVAIAEDGEILVKGELVMKGYWNDARATAETVEDGWLHTGDVGHIDADGQLMITDRKKDIIVSDKGDNVSPQRVEGMLALEPEIAQAMVYGDDKPYLVGLIVPEMAWLEGWANANGKPADLAALTEDKALAAELDAAVARVNKRLSGLERVRRFRIAREPFTVDNGQMTPTMKIRRHEIAKVYGAALEGLYRQARKDSASSQTGGRAG